MKLAPKLPPGRLNRKAKGFAAEIAELRTAGYTLQAIRDTLAEAGVQVSKSTVNREIQRLQDTPSTAASTLPTVPPHAMTTHGNAAAQPLIQRSAGTPVHRSGLDAAEAYVKGLITNPLIRNRNRP